MGYLKIKKSSYWDSMSDTGFGDRIRIWAYAYRLNKFHDFKFTILVDDFEWRELKYLNFPHTESETNIDLTNCEYAGKGRLDTSKNYYVNADSSIDNEVASQITLKDKKLEDKIKQSLKDRIGVHIRHWPISETDMNHNSTIERFNYEAKMDKVIEVLDKLNHKYNSKFYISSDVTYDRPPFGKCLPNFRKKENWLSQVYEKYDVIDYRDILSCDDEFPIATLNEKNENWLSVYDDEISLSGVKAIKSDGNELNIVEKDWIYDLKIKRDVIDLFSLIYSNLFIPSYKTGIHSRWSEFVECYRWK